MDGIGICKPKLIDTRSATLSTASGTRSAIRTTSNPDHSSSFALLFFIFFYIVRTFRGRCRLFFLLLLLAWVSCFAPFSHLGLFSLFFYSILGFDPRKLSENIRENRGAQGGKKKLSIKTIRETGLGRFLADMPQINPRGSHPILSKLLISTRKKERKKRGGGGGGVTAEEDDDDDTHTQTVKFSFIKNGTKAGGPWPEGVFRLNRSRCRSWFLLVVFATI